MAKEFCKVKDVPVGTLQVNRFFVNRITGNKDGADFTVKITNVANGVVLYEFAPGPGWPIIVSIPAGTEVELSCSHPNNWPSRNDLYVDGTWAWKVNSKKTKITRGEKVVELVATFRK